MNCPKCHGRGVVHEAFDAWCEVWHWLPCYDCRGSGIVHCCEGECEQPKGESDGSAERTGGGEAD